LFDEEVLISRGGSTGGGGGGGGGGGAYGIVSTAFKIDFGFGFTE